MTDRGIPGADGAVACPFVAFDDDRDARSTAPDHRHRCFAEPVPAPRAIAHQDAYCLSPAFAVCPAFQDWARREAAVARSAAAGAAPDPRPRSDDTSGPVPMPPAERESRHAPASAAQPPPPRRQPARDWAAPPPWLADAEDRVDEAPATAAPGAIAGWAAGSAGVGGAAAPRPRGGEEWGDASRGLADSPAARLAGPDPDMPAPARPTGARTPAPTRGDGDDEGGAYDDLPIPIPVPPVRPQSAAVTPPGSRSTAGDAPQGRPVPPPRTPSPRDGATPAPRDANEMFGPAWERPRRYEAYPTLRTRVGLPSLGGVPRLAIAAVALVLAAAFLFIVSPMILDLGRRSTPAGSAPPSPAASAVPSDSLAPTLAPAPTTVVYTVKSGDTLTKIAAKYGVTVKDLLAANPQIKNQNSIKIGDQITIPAPAGSSSGGVSGASPSVVVGASTAP